jgi:hypothetical protein
MRKVEIKKSGKDIFKQGDCFSKYGEIYMICMVESFRYQLIGLNSSNRWEKAMTLDELTEEILRAKKFEKIESGTVIEFTV